MSLRDRFLTFVTEQQPFAATVAEEAWDKAIKREPKTADELEKARVPLARALRTAVTWTKLPSGTETTPGVPVRDLGGCAAVPSHSRPTKSG